MTAYALVTDPLYLATLRPRLAARLADLIAAASCPHCGGTGLAIGGTADELVPCACQREDPPSPSDTETPTVRDFDAIPWKETTMQPYTVTPRDRDHASNPDAAFGVQAETVEQAAERAAHIIHGNDVTARRTTGDHGKSGYFQAYTYLAKVNAWCSVGESFHIG